MRHCQNHNNPHLIEAFKTVFVHGDKKIIGRWETDKL